MDNKELLLQMGFFEKDGWLCNPRLEGEAVFQIGSFEDKPLSYISSVMTATAFNAGSRFSRRSSKESLVDDLKSIIKKIEKSY